jgi:pimeloyl-ACP methyl ester carboxylesterase
LLFGRHRGNLIRAESPCQDFRNSTELSLRLRYRTCLVPSAARGVGVTLFLFLFAGFLFLASCASPERSAHRIAHRAGLAPLTLPGNGFEHRAYAALRGGEGTLVLLVDSDGTPWIESGTRAASDPTPRVPLALKLAAETPGPVLYLGRPCYYGAGPRSACTPRFWTSDRYSPEVVESMVAAADSFAAAHGLSRVLLVGYSGGGALAALMAPRLSRTVGVVTIAADLDTDAWAKWHRYAPLSGSLNPAAEPPLRVPEWHLVGGRDVNVPVATARRYLERVPPEQVFLYPTYDHACCWEELWPSFLRRLPLDPGTSH